MNGARITHGYHSAAPYVAACHAGSGGVPGSPSPRVASSVRTTGTDAIRIAGTAAISQLWLFIIAAPIGGLIAGATYEMLFGSGEEPVPLEVATEG